MVQHEELSRRDAGPPERVERLHRLAIVDPDARGTPARDVEEPLLRIAGERHAGDRLSVAAAFSGGFAPAIDPRLRQVLAFGREDLHPLAAPVRSVDEPVVRDLDAVDRAELRRLR